MAVGLTPPRARAAALGVLALAAVAALALWRRPQQGEPYVESATRQQTTGPVSVVLSGDSLLVTPSLLAGIPADLASVVRESTVAVTNLELVLLDGSPAPETPEAEPHAWPVGSGKTAEAIRRLGFNVVSCANNHAGDRGADGLRATTRVLDRVGCSMPDAARISLPHGRRPRWDNPHAESRHSP